MLAIFTNRKHLYKIVSASSDFSDSHLKKEVKRTILLIRNIYQLIIFLVVSFSLVTLALPFKLQEDNRLFITIMEIITFFALLIDLILKWITAPYSIGKGKLSYLLFPITFIGIILIISLLPSLYVLEYYDHTSANQAIYKEFESMKILRLFRIILLANLFPPLKIFKNVFSKNKFIYYAIFGTILFTILIFSLAIFNVEYSKDPETGRVHSFWDAFYFSTITLTTIGYGDFYPHTEIGKVIVIFMSIIGIAILAIPSGIIAASFIQEAKLLNAKRIYRKRLNKNARDKKKPTKKL